LAEDGIIKKLMTSVKCSICGHYYKVDNVNVLGHHEDLWFLKSHCSSCNSHCLVVAVIKEGRAPEVITDLTEAELDKFKSVCVLTGDELLDMHDFLKDFSGDFSQLFGQKKS